MDSNTDNHTQPTTHAEIIFLNTKVKVPLEISRDPVFLLFLSHIELVEIKYSEGELWMDKLQNNYKVRFTDPEMEMSIRKILKSRHAMQNK